MDQLQAKLFGGFGGHPTQQELDWRVALPNSFACLWEFLFHAILRPSCVSAAWQAQFLLGLNRWKVQFDLDAPQCRSQFFLASYSGIALGSSHDTNTALAPLGETRLQKSEPSRCPTGLDLSDQVTGATGRT